MICNQAPRRLATITLEAALAAELAASNAVFDLVHAQLSVGGQQANGVPCLAPATAPPGMQRRLLAIPSSAEEDLTSLLIQESLVYEVPRRLMLQGDELINTDLSSSGRQLSQYSLPPTENTDAEFVQRLEEVRSESHFLQRL